MATVEWYNFKKILEICSFCWTGNIRSQISTQDDRTCQKAMMNLITVVIYLIRGEYLCITVVSKAPLNRLCPCYGAIEIVEIIIIIIIIIIRMII